MGGQCKVKALMICTEKLPVPPVRGGAIQTYIAALAPLLSARCGLTIVGITDEQLPGRETDGRVRHARMPGGDLDIYGAAIADYLGRHTFDVIHIFNRPRLVQVVRAAAPQAHIVLSMHNDMFGPQKISPEEAAAAIEQVERIITVSDYVGRTIAKSYPQAKTKLRTIYSGVDLDRFTPSTGPEAQQTRDALHREHKLSGRDVILFVGRLSPKKGADILVRAMPELAKRHPDAALVLVGSKWYGEDKVSDYVAYVRALAARSPLPVVTTGFVAPDQVHKWFWAGDVFVCPSQWEEPLARVHYEAMAAGLPIITTARGGNPEVVAGAGNGLVVAQPQDPSAFAEALSTILRSDRSRQEMGDRGRALAEKRYGWARVAKEILETWGR